jgi:hypothetical protein
VAGIPVRVLQLQFPVSILTEARLAISTENCGVVLYNKAWNSLTRETTTTLIHDEVQSLLGYTAM